MRRKLAAGNWKMNGLRADLTQLATLAEQRGDDVDVLICLPATLIGSCAVLPIAIGGQDCHMATHGAHTGDLSAAMLADVGATHVITGHSERRTDHHETDAIVAAKSRAATRPTTSSQRMGLIPVPGLFAVTFSAVNCSPA